MVFTCIDSIDRSQNLMCKIPGMPFVVDIPHAFFGDVLPSQPLNTEPLEAAQTRGTAAKACIFESSWR
jgi:hypothetical protein